MPQDCKSSVIALFGQNTDHSSVPAKVCAAFARSVGPGRPPGRRASASPLTAASPMAALRCLRTMVWIVAILAASKLSSGPAHAQQNSRLHVASMVSLVPLRTSVSESSKVRCTRTLDTRNHARRKPGQTASSIKKGRHGIDADHAGTWTELRARYGLGAIPMIPGTTSWQVPHTFANSTIATARQGSLPPTTQDLDATNVIWQRGDRCRRRRKPMSRCSHP